MPPLTPRQVHEQFTDAFLAHDMDVLIALCDPDATMISGPGQAPVHGFEAIREARTALQTLT